MQEEIEHYTHLFWSNYDVVGSCWIWNGKLNKNPKYGYDNRGYFWWKPEKKSYLAHRLAYKLSNGEIPAGFVIRHTCDNPLCVNPHHLLLGTVADNYQDMISRNRAFYQKQTHCKYGHPWSSENTSYIKSGGKMIRRCKACHARDRKKYRIRQQLREKNKTV